MVSVGEDARAAARRIVDAVLAERGEPAPAVRDVLVAEVAGGARTDEPVSEAHRTARRIVEEVLAGKGEEVLAGKGEEVLAGKAEEVLAGKGEEVLATAPAAANGAATARQVDPAALATARRIVEEVLAAREAEVLAAREAEVVAAREAEVPARGTEPAGDAGVAPARGREPRGSEPVAEVPRVSAREVDLDEAPGDRAHRILLEVLEARGEDLPLPAAPVPAPVEDRDGPPPLPAAALAGEHEHEGADGTAAVIPAGPVADDDREGEDPAEAVDDPVTVDDPAVVELWEPQPQPAPGPSPDAGPSPDPGTSPDPGPSPDLEIDLDPDRRSDDADRTAPLPVARAEPAPAPPVARRPTAVQVAPITVRHHVVLEPVALDGGPSDDPDRTTELDLAERFVDLTELEAAAAAGLDDRGDELDDGPPVAPLVAVVHPAEVLEPGPPPTMAPHPDAVDVLADDALLDHTGPMQLTDLTAPAEVSAPPEARAPTPQRVVAPAPEVAQLPPPQASERVGHRPAVSPDRGSSRRRDRREPRVPSEAPRSGRWLVTTVVGAVALAFLLPLAVAALRDLVSLA